jgi:hypothetical protein
MDADEFIKVLDDEKNEEAARDYDAEVLSVIRRDRYFHTTVAFFLLLLIPAFVVTFQELFGCASIYTCLLVPLIAIVFLVFLAVFSLHHYYKIDKSIDWDFVKEFNTWKEGVEKEFKDLLDTRNKSVKASDDDVTTTFITFRKNIFDE